MFGFLLFNLLPLLGKECRTGSFEQSLENRPLSCSSFRFLCEFRHSLPSRGKHVGEQFFKHGLLDGPKPKDTLLGTPNREPQECSRNILTRVLIFYCIPTLFVGFLVWGSQKEPFYSPKPLR